MGKRGKVFRVWLVLTIVILGVFFVLNLIYPLPTHKLNRPSSVTVFSKDGKLLRIFCASDGRWRIKCKINELSPFLVQAVVAYEDRCFYWHPGINPYSILRAAMTNIKHRRVICGGSTLTMQIARMIEPKQRTFVSKLIELFRVIQLELKYSKTQLLEFYFNLAPYGGNLEGVASASYFYFGKAPSALSSAEATLLVSLPNSPERLRPDKNPVLALRNRQKVAARLLKHKVISNYLEIVNSDLPQKREGIPFIAPHLGELVRNKFKDRCIMKTCLDLRLQRLCEKALREHLKPLLAQDISNGAVVVIENKTHAVRALVGSLDFLDKIHSGQVNGALSPRSPGSLLKPFIYCLAMDEGMLSSKTMLLDVPVEYSGYSPTNYDDKFHGPVNAEDALKESLNVPAVNLCAKIKGSRFYYFLKQGGISTLTKPAELYGLPLILGACEVSLLEMTNLYSTLANGGEYRPYRLLEDERVVDGKRLFSIGAAYIIGEILSEIRRPDLPICWEFSLDLPKVAWKTGTSYGHHDAWSIGYNPDYTIGVWLGNFDGTEASALVGAEVAAPLLFHLFNSITAGKGNWFERPQGVGFRQVCSLSGQLPSPDCPQTKEEIFIYGVAPSAVCQMHKIYEIDDKTGYSLCPHCRQERKYHKKLFVKWDQKLATWLAREGYPVPKIPTHNPNCLTILAENNPIIRSPVANCEYYLREWANKGFQKILLDASVSNNVEKIYWFVDGELLYTVSPKQKVFYYPTVGKHIIKCVDDEGLCAETVVRVY